MINFFKRIKEWFNPTLPVAKVPLALFDDSVKINNIDNIINFQKDQSKIRIGSNSTIDGQLIINPYGGEIRIGSFCNVGRNSVIQSGIGIYIGNDVQISTNVNIVDNNAHEIDYLERQETARKILTEGYEAVLDRGNILAEEIHIEDNVWINFNCIVLKGVRIGKGAIVGAGSVVTKDVPPFSLVVGIPAKVVKTLN